jgi:DNA-binding CsgD family transcriptional regulator
MADMRSGSGESRRRDPRSRDASDRHVAQAEFPATQPGSAADASQLTAPALSRRERQCVYWMAMGKHDGETALILDISAHTVREYIDSAKVKLGAQTRPELSLRALACGLLAPDRCLML